MPNIAKLERDISTFLLALRSTIERPYRIRSRGVSFDRERLRRALLLVEEARVNFNTLVRYGEPTPNEWRELRRELLVFVNELLNSPDVDASVFDRAFRLAVPPQERERLSPFLQTIVANELTVADALLWFQTTIDNSSIDDLGQTSLNFEDLVRIVPSQQVAPARFAVAHNRIILADRAPVKNQEDRENISAALEHIKSSGSDLISNLENSNCDRRLLESVRELHTQISNDDNIVKVGLTNLACSVMSGQFKDELPDALNAMFNSYTSSISMYVAQFPEWEQFTQRAAAIELDDADITEIYLAAGEVIQTLEEQPNLADPEVPKTIRLVREFMARPGSSAKRAAFAMMRTLENLVASIVNFSLSIVKKTAEKTADQISTTASVVIVGLLSIALVGATGIGEAATHAGAPWVAQAAELVQQQISKLAQP